MDRKDKKPIGKRRQGQARRGRLLFVLFALFVLFWLFVSMTSFLLRTWPLSSSAYSAFTALNSATLRFEMIRMTNQENGQGLPRWARIVCIECLTRRHVKTHSNPILS